MELDFCDGIVARFGVTGGILTRSWTVGGSGWDAGCVIGFVRFGAVGGSWSEVVDIVRALTRARPVERSSWQGMSGDG